MKSLRKVLKKPFEVLKSKRVLMTLAVLFVFVGIACATGNGAGIGAFDQVSANVKSYIPAVKKLIYAIAGVVALTGCISIYVKMNNDEQDVKKSIMMVVGACVFLIAAAEALPMFFE